MTVVIEKKLNMRKLLYLVSLLILVSSCGRSYDVIVVGGTPGGIMTAIAATTIARSITAKGTEHENHSFD